MRTYGDGFIRNFQNMADTIDKYVADGGLHSGLTTGWTVLDNYLRLAQGQLNVVTGIPSSGKSEWMDQVMLHSIALHQWHWSIFSPENWPLPHHFQKLAEKWTGKPMFGHWNVDCMANAEIVEARTTLGNYTSFLEPAEGKVTIDGLLELLSEDIEQNNTNAFLLDPYNEVEHCRPAGMTETEYIGQVLTTLRNYGRRHNIAMFIVAHPTKLIRKDDGNYPVPTPYDISGSSNWRNKADSCISVWRNYQEDDGVVQIHIQKIRNKNLGRLGEVHLYWNRPNGLFFESLTDLQEVDRHGIKYRIA